MTRTAMPLTVLPRTLLVVLAAALPTAGAAAADWPQFRGPEPNNVAEGEGHPLEWGEGKNIAWRAAVPGRGWATPIVVGGKVFVATAVPDEADRQSGDRYTRQRWELICLDLATGEKLWGKVAKTGEPTIGTHQDNTYASETPVSDGQRVYVYFGMTGVFCYDLDGDLVWQKDLGSYPMEGDWGTSSSPVLHDGRLILQIDNEEESFLVALDSQTGNELWRAPREDGSNWSTPIIWTNSLRTELVTGGHKFRSYDPATGRLLWTLEAGGSRSTSSPAAVGDLLVVGSEDRASRGSGKGGVFALKPGASGAIVPDANGAHASLRWGTTEVATGMSSPLIYQGQVYILSRDGGVVHALDAETGAVSYQERVRGAQAFWASPWAAGGKVLLPDDRGGVHVIEPGAEFKLVRTNEIPGRLWASNAVADGALLLRFEDELICIK